MSESDYVLCRCGDDAVAEVDGEAVCFDHYLIDMDIDA